MDTNTSMTKHLYRFDDLVVRLQTLQEPMDDARQLVILLSSLPTEYETILLIVENSKGRDADRG